MRGSAFSVSEEPREQIDRCLTCKIPVQLCTGDRKCAAAKRSPIKSYKPKKTEIVCSVSELVKAGKKRAEIRTALGIDSRNISTYVNRAVALGLISQDEADSSRDRHYPPGKRITSLSRKANEDEISSS